MTESIGLEKLRRNLSQVIGKVRYGSETYIIESYGQPTAVLLSIDEYEQFTSVALEMQGRPARIVSPRLADPAQIEDFELDVIEESMSHG